MKFEKYANAEAFAVETLDILLENEVQNNIPISFINKSADKSDWLFGSVKDANGDIVLVAACTPPFNIVLYETDNRPNDTAIRLLSDELKSMGFSIPGVLAEQGLAERFAKIHTKDNGFQLHVSMNIMQLDKVNNIEKAPGLSRPLCEEDLFYVPYWKHIAGEEMNTNIYYDIPTHINRAKGHIGKDTYFIWEDSHPVSQAFNPRNTLNGAGIGGVYTPPHYRGKGYASSVVAELSSSLLEHGNKFCFLFADAKNPISCGIYRKIGYYDLCIFNEIQFEKE